MDGSIILNETMTSTETNFTEVQEDTDSWLATNNVLIICLNIFAFFNTYGTMFFMGCDISLEQIKGAWNYRKCVPVGLAGQYLLMPACGYLVIRIFGITSLDAAGITIVTCSPGGGYSNLLTYLFDGDVWLSVLITTVSTVLAFGAMPLNLWIYRASGNLSVPYLQMFIALLLLNLFLVLGIIFKWKVPKFAVLVTRVGVTMLSVSNLAWTVIWIYVNPTFFVDTSWRLYFSVLVVIGVGMSSVGLVTRFLSFPASAIKTLAIETSYQSVGTAYTVSIISFEGQAAMKVQGYIFLYCISTTFFGTLLGGIFQLVKNRRNSKKAVMEPEAVILKE